MNFTNTIQALVEENAKLRERIDAQAAEVMNLRAESSQRQRAISALRRHCGCKMCKAMAAGQE